ncbi:MAG TPA: hypothetical protein PK294_00225 [Ignavibacteria bacterium]|nr:hypothetical protein [Ignavibacteria bacterium]
MGKSNLLFTLITLILFSTVFSSCISISRNIKVNSDGTGSEILNLTFKKEFYDVMASMTSLMDSTRRQGFLDSLYSDEVFENKTIEKYDSIQGIKVIDLNTVMNSDSSKTFTIDYEFDDIKKIGSSLNYINENDDKYKTDVIFKEDNGKVTFLYLYEMKGDDLSEELGDNDSLAQKMKLSMAMMFEGGDFDFEVEMPYDVISTNATEQDGRKLKWHYQMSDIFTKDKISLEAEMQK